MGKFRGDIEGLRGVAVTMVVLAHAGIPWTPGGFVGVDVFFVISGFLITALLRDELVATGRVSFQRFYARRVRRLLPAIAGMLLATMLLAIVLLPTVSWPSQAEGMGWAAVWLSNVYFAISDFDYFGPGVAGNLYLHTWSLGVEEQFYLLWPALLAVLWKMGGIRGLRLGVLFCVLAGFGLAVLAIQQWPLKAYYMTPFRIWQLGIGGLLHFVPALSVVPVRIGALLRPVGLLVLLGCSLWLDPERLVYPGGWALIPTLAAALLLIPANDKAVTWILDSRPARFLGGLSYSWYLWHWPALVLAFHVYGRSLMVGVLAAAVSLLLAWASWRWVEIQRRPGKVGSERYWVLTGVAVSLLLFLVAGQWKLLGEQVQAAKPDVASASEFAISVPRLYQYPNCDEWFHASRVVPCLMVKVEDPAAPTLVLLGDSVAAQWEPAFSAIAQRRGLNLVVLTKSSCAMVDRPFVYARINRRFVECEQWRDGVVQYLAGLEPAMIVVGSSAGYGGLSLDDWYVGTRDFLSRIRSMTTEVVVLAPTPILPFHGPKCNAEASSLLGSGCVAALSEIRSIGLLEALRSASSEVSGARVVDMAETICPGQKCAAIVGGMLTYRDEQHLNAAYAQELSPALEHELFPVQ